jgi:hypothetical protein
LPQKRSLALASIPQSLAAAEIASMRHLRDFRSTAISEFFNTIGCKADIALGRIGAFVFTPGRPSAMIRMAYEILP